MKRDTLGLMILALIWLVALVAGGQILLYDLGWNNGYDAAIDDMVERIDGLHYLREAE